MFYITACPGHSRSPALARHSHRAALCLEPNVHSSMRQETQARRTFESHSRNIREIFSRRTGGSNTWDLTCSWQWPRSWRPLWPLGPSSGCFSAKTTQLLRYSTLPTTNQSKIPPKTTSKTQAGQSTKRTGITSSVLSSPSYSPSPQTSRPW